MYRDHVACNSRRRPSRRGERGQASLLYALGLTLLTLVFITMLDVGLVEAANQRVAGYAEQVALAGAEAATALNGFGTGANTTPLLNPALARQQAQVFFQGLALGPTYRLTILAATPTELTVQVQTTQPIFLWPGPVLVSEAATETPQADTT